MKIAIVKLSALGDIVHAMIVLQCIKKYKPDVMIDWIVESSLAQILEYNKDIHAVLPVHIKQLKKKPYAIFQQIKQLRAYARNNYDCIIDMQGLLKSACIARLLGSCVVGFDRDSIKEKIASFFYKQKVKISYEANIIERNIKLISEALHISITNQDILNKKSFLFFDRISPIFLRQSKKIILLIVGASRANKRYPYNFFSNIAQNIDADFLVIYGDSKEKKIADMLVFSNSNIKSIPPLSLNELKQLICDVDLVIGGDTGPAHMAWGLNKPSIILFGNTPYLRNAYETKINKVLTANIKACQTSIDHSDFSIQKIDPKIVQNTILELL